MNQTPNEPTPTPSVGPSRYVAPNGRMDAWSAVAVRWLTDHGISLFGSRVLAVRGRKSGELRTVPVNLLELDGQRYLVAPRGNTQWVRNARAAGGGQLRLGSAHRGRASSSSCPPTSGCRCCGSTSPGGAGRSAGSSRACPRSPPTPRSPRSRRGSRSSTSARPRDPNRVLERLPATRPYPTHGKWLGSARERRTGAPGRPRPRRGAHPRLPREPQRALAPVGRRPHAAPGRGRRRRVAARGAAALVAPGVLRRRGPQGGRDRRHGRLGTRASSRCSGPSPTCRCRWSADSTGRCAPAAWAWSPLPTSWCAATTSPSP